MILATAVLVGEGYDLPRLDTLILTMPLSFNGRQVQYAGRLHRPHTDKDEVRIYDYLDDHPITLTVLAGAEHIDMDMGLCRANAGRASRARAGRDIFNAKARRGKAAKVGQCN